MDEQFRKEMEGRRDCILMLLKSFIRILEINSHRMRDPEMTRKLRDELGHLWYLMDESLQ